MAAMARHLLLARQDDGSGDGSIDGNIAGASGSSDGTMVLSRGAVIAIIVVVVAVVLFGIATSILFYIAKKREWTLKETLRRSARKVVTALTPRRTEFPRSVKEGSGGKAGRTRLDDVPPTPRIKARFLTDDREVDLEKGDGDKVEGGKKKKRANFSRK